MLRTLLAGAALAASLIPASLAAQDLGLIEGLFDEVTAITVSYQTGRASSDAVESDGMLHGAGTEVLINLRSTPRLSYELGLGASYLRGYQSVEPSLDLRATLRALPTVSLYASRSGPVTVYGGGTFGLVELWNAQAYGPSGQPWSVEARTFELGGSVGLYLGQGPLAGLFAEAGYRLRDFQSVRYTPSADETLPDAWPRSLDFSGPVASLGWQVQLASSEAAEQAAAAAPPAGTWVVQRVDASPLPALLEVRESGRREVVHGVLRLSPDSAGADRGEWRLELYLRETGGAVAPGDPPIRTAMVIESGRYDPAAGGVLVLTEPAANTVLLAERLHGRIYLSREGHVLMLAPADAPPPAP